MRRRSLVSALALLAAGALPAAAQDHRGPARSPHPHRLHLRRELPYNGFIPPLPRQTLPPLDDAIPPPPLPAPRSGPSAPIGPLPSGFTMTLVQGQEADPDRAAPIGTPRDIARRIAACWQPPVFDDGHPAEITLRLQFSKSGTIIGKPRVSYVASPADGRDKVVDSMTAALKDCTPLRFTARLGAGIAGYPFAIRFIAASRRTDHQ